MSRDRIKYAAPFWGAADSSLFVLGLLFDCGSFDERGILEHNDPLWNIGFLAVFGPLGVYGFLRYLGSFTDSGILSIHDYCIK